MTAATRIPCIGSAHWDVIGSAGIVMTEGSDVPGRIAWHPGGVALNIANSLARFGMTPTLLTAIGEDDEGERLVAFASEVGIDTTCVYRTAELPTDSYMAIEGANGLIAAIADAHSLEAAGDRILRPLSDGRLGSAEAPFSGPIALDGNLTSALLAEIATSPIFERADLRVAPASPGKAERLAPLLDMPNTTVYVNVEEAGILCGSRFDNAREAATALLELGANRALVTNGEHAVADGSRTGIILADPPAANVARVTGAGDTFLAAHVAAEIAGAPPKDALDKALWAAADHISRGIAS